jgi:hypothetical protein
MAPYFFEPGRLSRGGSSDLWMSTRELHRAEEHDEEGQHDDADQHLHP